LRNVAVRFLSISAVLGKRGKEEAESLAALPQVRSESGYCANPTTADKSNNRMIAYTLRQMSSSDRVPASTRDVIRRAAELIAERLPQAWKSELRDEVAGERRQADAVLTVEAPDGNRALVVIEAKKTLETRDAIPLAEQLNAFSATFAAGEDVATGLLAAPYINPAARVRLTELGVGYADATGNLRLQLDRPALFLRDVGADRDPWRGPGRPRGSFKGATAARVFRALADFAPPYSVPELVRLADASSGVTYRVVEFLEREDMVRREPGKGIVEVDWRQLIERWSREYGFALSPSATAFLEPRGVETALEKLRDSDLQYALTSSSASQFYAPYAPVRALSAYVTSIDEAAAELGLRAAPSGGNVLLAVPEDKVAFERTMTFDRVVAAAPSQVAADLLGGPGRAPEEGRVLLEWMAANEPAWRR
jgi:hypothetical protein